MTLSLDTAYRSFGGEVEASSTPTICRLPDSRRHQLWAIAHRSKEARMLAEKFFLVLETLLSHTNPDGGPRVESTSRQVPIKLHAEAASSLRADGFHLAIFSGWTVRRMPTSVEP